MGKMKATELFNAVATGFVLAAAIIVSTLAVAQAPATPTAAPAVAAVAAPAAVATAPTAVKFASTGDAMEGKAAWYGKRFAGRKTASGQIFDPAAMTAAHNTLAFGTKVKVTNKKTTKLSFLPLMIAAHQHLAASSTFQLSQPANWALCALARRL